mgnify:CR=1 FL=1
MEIAARRYQDSTGGSYVAVLALSYSLKQAYTEGKCIDGDVRLSACIE